MQNLPQIIFMVMGKLVKNGESPYVNGIHELILTWIWLSWIKLINIFKQVVYWLFFWAQHRTGATCLGCYVLNVKVFYDKIVSSTWPRRHFSGLSCSTNIFSLSFLFILILLNFFSSWQWVLQCYLNRSEIRLGHNWANVLLYGLLNGTVD